MFSVRSPLAHSLHGMTFHSFDLIWLLVYTLHVAFSPGFRCGRHWTNNALSACVTVRWKTPTVHAHLVNVGRTALRYIYIYKFMFVWVSCLKAPSARSNLSESPSFCLNFRYVLLIYCILYVLYICRMRVVWSFSL